MSVSDRSSRPGREEWSASFASACPSQMHALLRRYGAQQRIAEATFSMTSIDAHDTAPWLFHPIGFSRYGHSDRCQGSSMLCQWGPTQPFFDRLEFRKTLELQHTIYERGRSPPPLLIYLNPGEGRISKEACDADVSDGKIVEDETLLWRCSSKVIQDLWHTSSWIPVWRLCSMLLVPRTSSPNSSALPLCALKPALLPSGRPCIPFTG